MRLLAADRVAPWRSPCPDSIDEFYRPHPWWPIPCLFRRAVSLVHPMSTATAAWPVLAGQPDIRKDVHMARHYCSPKMVGPARSGDPWPVVSCLLTLHLARLTGRYPDLARPASL